MIGIISQNGDTQYNVMEYVVDTANDIWDLPTDIAMGSSALVLENGSLYMLNSAKQWVEM